ncbi:MAG: c-type cytochrome [Pseudohongiellaceae bacterium]
MKSRTLLPFAPALLLALWGSTLSAADNDPPAFAYLLHCAGCHLEDGSGDPPIVPDLRTDLGLLLDNAEGRSYMLRVPGVADSPVAESQMAALMNWLITRLYPERTDFKPFTVEEVAAARADRLADPLRHRRELFAELTGNKPTAAEQ